MPSVVPNGRTLCHYLLIVFDSCRYDSFLAAGPRHLRKLGRVERRWSYASWTAPSHYNLLTGLMPHRSPKHVYASEYYKADFLKFNERLGGAGIEFQSLVPSLYLPPFLQRLGYRTHARVSLPVLNPHTVLNCGFDSYKLMPKHNDFSAILEELEFSGERPCFYLLNVGETHYPYALANEPPDLWPRLSGVHGVVKKFDSKPPTAAQGAKFLFQEETGGVARAPGGGRPVSRRHDGEAIRYRAAEHLHHRHLGSWRVVWGGWILRTWADSASQGFRSAVRRRENPLTCQAARSLRTLVRAPASPSPGRCLRWCWRSRPTWFRFCSGRSAPSGAGCVGGARCGGRTSAN